MPTYVDIPILKQYFINKLLEGTPYYKHIGDAEPANSICLGRWDSKTNSLSTHRTAVCVLELSVQMECVNPFTASSPDERNVHGYMHHLSPVLHEWHKNL